MEDLPFYQRLNPLQKSYADKIAAEARAMGISPKLAVAIAYQESRLNPNVSTGGAGEIGIMQIKPTTAQEMGFSTKDISDPDKNIKAGLAYLKKSLELSQGDERLAAAGYNAGINHPFFTPKGNKLPETTVNYLMSLKESGAFAPTMATETAEASQATEGSDFGMEKAETVGGATGAVIGSGMAARRAAVDLARAGGRKVSQSIAESVVDKLSQPGPRAPSAPPSTPLGGGMASELADDALRNRILQGTIEPETGATGRARMGGFNIETAQQAARTKQAAETLGALQRSGVLTQTPQSVLANAPGMTATPSGVLFPRSPSVPPPTPPARGALDEITEVFKRMIGPESTIRKIGGGLMRYGAPPLSLYQTGSELGALTHELDRPDTDPLKATLHGIGALGAFGSMFPATAPVALPVAVAAPLFSSALEEGRKRPLGQIGEVVAP